MAQYIDKAAVVAEIESLRCTSFTNFDEGVNATVQTQHETLDTIEVKEVDLEKEFYNFLDTLIGKDNGRLSEDELFRIAEYFFELGLKAQKGE